MDDIETKEYFDFSNISRNFIKKYALGYSTSYILNFELGEYMAIDPALDVPKKIGVTHRDDKLYYVWTEIARVREEIGVPDRMKTDKAYLHHYRLLERKKIIRLRYTFFDMRTKLMFVAFNPDLLVEMTGFNYKCKIGTEGEINQLATFILCCKYGVGPTGKRFHIFPYLNPEEKLKWESVLGIFAGEKLENNASEKGSRISISENSRLVLNTPPKKFHYLRTGFDSRRFLLEKKG